MDEQAGKNAFLTEKDLRLANIGTTTYVNEVNEKKNNKKIDLLNIILNLARFSTVYN